MTFGNADTVSETSGMWLANHHAAEHSFVVTTFKTANEQTIHVCYRYLDQEGTSVLKHGHGLCARAHVGLLRA